MDVNDYLIDHQEFDWRELLSGWEWLLPNDFTIWLMNRFGDLILVFEDESVHYFDLAIGDVIPIADNREEFLTLIENLDNANQWLMIPLVDAATKAGLALEKGKCYGFKKPPVLGGDYKAPNLAVVSIAEHYGFCADLHQQIKDLPDGEEVELDVADDDHE